MKRNLLTVLFAFFIVFGVNAQHVEHTTKYNIDKTKILLKQTPQKSFQ